MPPSARPRTPIPIEPARRAAAERRAAEGRAGRRPKGERPKGARSRRKDRNDRRPSRLSPPLEHPFSPFCPTKLWPDIGGEEKTSSRKRREPDPGAEPAPPLSLPDEAFGRPSPKQGRGIRGIRETPATPDPTGNAQGGPAPPSIEPTRRPQPPSQARNRRPISLSFFPWESMGEVLMPSPVVVVCFGFERSKEKFSSDL